jgi:hypothetical protein
MAVFRDRSEELIKQGAGYFFRSVEREIKGYET